MLWAASLTSEPLLSPTDCTVFCSEQSLTVCLAQVNLTRTGVWVAWPGYMNAMHSTGGQRKAGSHEVLSLFPSYPLDAGDRVAKCKLRAVKKSGVCVLIDRQLSLLLKGHQRLKASSSCHLAP